MRPTLYSDCLRDRNQTNQLEGLKRSGQQRGLLIVQQAFALHLEAAPPAFATQNRLRLPMLRKHRTVLSQFVDQPEQCRISRSATEVCAKLGHQALSPLTPVSDQGARHRRKEHIPQQIFIRVRMIQPPHEKCLRGSVPCARTPLVIQQVGWHLKQLGQGQHLGCDRRIGWLKLHRIAPPGQIKQRRPLRLVEPQSLRQTGQRLRRGRDITTLLQPGDPSHPNTSRGSQLFTPPTRRAPPSRGLRRQRQAFPVRPNKDTQHSAWIDCFHGSFYTCISDILVPV